MFDQRLCISKLQENSKKIANPNAFDQKITVSFTNLNDTKKSIKITETDI